jgi:hypothetical protein
VFDVLPGAADHTTPSSSCSGDPRRSPNRFPTADREEAHEVAGELLRLAEADPVPRELV